MYNRNDDDIEEISQWLRDTKFLPDNLSPDIIHLFLSSVDGDKNKTKIILSNYYYVRQSIPELFAKRDALLKKNFLAWKGSCFFPLKGKLNGNRLFLGAVLDGNLYNFEVFVKQMYMCYDLLIMTNDWDTGGRILVFSYYTVQYQNLASYTMYLTKKSMECQTKNYLPGKLKEIHNVHVQPFLKNLLSGLKEKVKSENCEVFIHKNLHSLHNYIGPEFLPLELGGSAGTLESIAVLKDGSPSRDLEKIMRQKLDNFIRVVEGDVVIKFHKDLFTDEEMKRIQETKAKRN